MARAKPHLLLFNPDEWRGDVLGHLGNVAAYTPVLDRLVSSEAVSFKNAFCQSPVCTPSRTSFMTGWYPHVRGHRTMHHMLHEHEPVLLQTLREAGYFVWWGGKNDLVPAGRDAPGVYCDVRFEPAFSSRTIRPLWASDREERWRGVPGSDTYYSFYTGLLDSADDDKYYDQDWANVFGAISQIRAWGESCQTDKQPLCIYLALTYPHPPYGVENPWFDLIDRKRMPPRIGAPHAVEAERKPSILAGIRARQGLEAWNEDRWNELRAVYYGMCARVDHQLGLVLQALKDAGMYDDTALMFFSDHGDFTGDYGLVEKTQNTFEDSLTRVPLVIKPPAAFPVAAGIRHALVELVDIPATVEEIAGVRPRHSHFGRSLVPLLGAGVDIHRDAVFSEGGRLAGEKQAMERESPSSYDCSGLYWPRLSLQVESDRAHTKAVMCRTNQYKYVRRLYEDDELYDLTQDPGEENNVAKDARYASILADLQDRLLTWYQSTCDVVPLIPDHR